MQVLKNGIGLACVIVITVFVVAAVVRLISDMASDSRLLNFISRKIAELIQKAGGKRGKS